MAEFDTLHGLGASADGSIAALGFGGAFQAGAIARIAMFGEARASTIANGRAWLRGLGGAFAAGGIGTTAMRGSATPLIVLPNPAIANGETGLLGEVSTYSITFSQADGRVGMRGVGGAAEAGAFGFIAMRGQVHPNAEEQNAITLMQHPGWLYMTFGYERAFVYESVGATSGAEGQPIAVVGESVGVDGGLASLLEALNSLTDGIGPADIVQVIYRMVVAEGIDLDSREALAFGTQVVEALAMLSGHVGRLEVLGSLAEMLAVNDALARSQSEAISEDMGFLDALAQALIARNTAVEKFALGAVQANSASFSVIVGDRFHLDDSTTSVLEAFNALREQIGFSVVLRIGDSVFSAWVCNAETRAFSNYENFPFNSFFEQGGRYFGVAPDGIYELVGDDDDGEPITARVRLGLSNLGTGKMKRLPSMYLGLTAAGDLLLQVITTSPDGEKEANVYRIRTPNAAALREARVKIGRGLKSVYWDVELQNIDGAAFALDVVELFPMILDRRIDGGSNG